MEGLFQLHVQLQARLVPGAQGGDATGFPGRPKLHTPIAFLTRRTVRDPKNQTLHIYNNPGIRNGYSVAYGFQRNKECLHGQDSVCVVYSEVGRVRALVLSANRFAGNQNLNYLKDNFQIEAPEKFVTILNGGSIFEPCWSRRRIETTLSSSRSQTWWLYDKERRFLQSNAAMVRKQRLYHHLPFSTFYDVADQQQRALWIVNTQACFAFLEKSDPNLQQITSNDQGYMDTLNRMFEKLMGDLHKSATKAIRHLPLRTALEHEVVYTRYVEPFEKMQALEAEAFFLLEDYEKSRKVTSELYGQLSCLYHGCQTYLFPIYNHYELQMLLFSTIFRNMSRNCHDHITYTYKTNFWSRLRSQNVDPKWVQRVQDQWDKDIKKKRHRQDFLNLSRELCKHDEDHYAPLYYDSNANDTVMSALSLDRKYEMIDGFIEERKQRQKFNDRILEHYKDKKTEKGKWHDYEKEKMKPHYHYPRQKYELADQIFSFKDVREKMRDYRIVSAELKSALTRITDQMEFDDLDNMEDVIRQLKYGGKLNEMRNYRRQVHDEVRLKEAPGHMKKRALVEMGGMELTMEEVSKHDVLNPLRVNVDAAFQVSWLMPKDGGYYYYPGSSPIPPCFRAQNVIVFRKPIKMTRRQIDILTRVPTSFETDRDLRVTTPYVHDIRFEVSLAGVNTKTSRIEEVMPTVYYQPRNHLFLGHDGVHKNAVEEWDKIEKRKAKSSAPSPQNFGYPPSCVVFLLVVFFV